MIYGTGAPLIKSIWPDGSVAKTWTNDTDLPVAPKGGQNVNIEFLSDPQENPLTGQMLPRIFGFRYKFTLTYTGMQSVDDLFDSGLVDNLMEIAAVREPLKLLVTPHHDGPLTLKAFLSDFDFKYTDGFNAFDTISLEFTEYGFRKRPLNPDTFYGGSINKGTNP